MMGEKSSSVDEFLMPGFRFHPTDEELVGFYLKRKLQQRPLPIELIKQVDIYKYDPWDLPKLSSTGEKEWYFYCLRDRKYRNSTRPNRVTGSGFWKATGTDRPIYSSDGGKCIGLKKSLVFYRGRAARGMKTDWMMHEFRLPAATTDGLGASTPGPAAKKILDHSLPPNESWAICRIFKKMNSMSSRALSHSLPDAFPYTSFDPHTIENDFQIAAAAAKPSIIFTPDNFPGNLVFSQPDEEAPAASATGNTSTPDRASMLFNPPPPSLPGCKAASGTVGFELSPHHQFNDYYHTSVAANSSQHNMMQSGISPDHYHQTTINVQASWDNVRSMGFPFSLPSAELESYSWEPDLPWDPSPQCGSDISSNAYSTN